MKRVGRVVSTLVLALMLCPVVSHHAAAQEGTEKWSFPTGGAVTSSPAIGTDGTIYVGSEDTKLYAINPEGTLRWSFPTGDTVWSSPAVGSDGTVYVGSNDDKLYAINPDGTEKWSFTTGGNVRSSPAIGTDGTVYVGSDDGKLYAVYGDSGGPARSAWPMFHHDLKRTGNVLGEFERTKGMFFPIQNNRGGIIVIYSE